MVKMRGGDAAPVVTPRYVGSHVQHVRELPPVSRGAVVAILGHKFAARGLGPRDEPNSYGVELDALIDACGLPVDDDE